MCCSLVSEGYTPAFQRLMPQQLHCKAAADTNCTIKRQKAVLHYANPNLFDQTAAPCGAIQGRTHTLMLSVRFRVSSPPAAATSCFVSFQTVLAGSLLSADAIACISSLPAGRRGRVAKFPSICLPCITQHTRLSARHTALTKAQKSF